MADSAVLLAVLRGAKLLWVLLTPTQVKKKHSKQHLILKMRYKNQNYVTIRSSSRLQKRRILLVTQNIVKIKTVVKMKTEVKIKTEEYFVTGC